MSKSHEIVAAINRFALETIGIAQVSSADRDLLLDLSLREMLAAVDEINVENDKPAPPGQSKIITVVPDDRLTSAVYTLLHWRLRPFDEDDDVLVRFTEGGLVPRVHFLAVCQRENSQLQEDAA